MAKITKITTQQKSKHRYNIFLNDGKGEKYGFSVDEAVLIEFNLRKGLELADSLITTLVQKDAFYKSYSAAIFFLSYRMRTKKEMHDYLVKKEVEEIHIAGIIDKLTAEGLLNDRQFAEAFVNTRIHTSSKGPQLVKRELIEKGVAQSIAENAVAPYSYEIQYDKAVKWVEKRLRTSKKDSFQRQLQQLQLTLMQKGFTNDVIQDALHAVRDKKDANAEWEAIVHHGEKIARRHKKKYAGFELRNKVKEGLYRRGFTMEGIQKFIEEWLD